MNFLLRNPYSKVETQDVDEDLDSRASLRRGWKYTAVLGICCFIAGALSLEGAKSLTSILGQQPAGLELRSIQHSFTYNRSFSQAPSPHTDRSWRELFPLEGGFFINDHIAPTRSTFSAFHQLHCLDNIRKSYWHNHDAALSGIKITDEDTHVDIRPSHVRHCIDLIRQSLMCQADTTVETVDEATNGVHGFRVVHMCKDWEQLVRWTSRQQVGRKVEQIV